MTETRAFAEAEVRLEQGVVRYREVGEGEPVVFVHGVLVNGDLWRNVAPPLADEGFRCVAPDWPLGGHSLPMKADADLTPPGLARLVADFLAALDLRGVTLVGNDTGGAVCQLVIARHPERVARLVLTNCDAFENFPPPLVLPFKWGAFVPGFVSLAAGLLRANLSRRLLLAAVARRVPEREVLDSYLAPLVREPGTRRDVTKVLRGISSRHTLDAARTFPDFRGPVLIAWGEDDFVFPRRDAQRLQRAFSNAKLERIAGSRTFIPEDQPERLAGLVRAFLRSPVTGSSPNSGLT